MPKPPPFLQPAAAKGSQLAASSKRLADRIRRMRLDRGWTLEMASERIGVSKSGLSKLERHEMSPTFNALHKVAAGFGLSMTELLTDERTEARSGASVTRADEGEFLPASHYRIRLVRSAVERTPAMVAVEFYVDATDIAQFERFDRHDDDNIVYVLDGPILFYQEGQPEPVTLQAGDSVSFDARIGHAFVSVPGCPVGRALSVTVRA